MDWRLDRRGGLIRVMATIIVTARLVGDTWSEDAWPLIDALPDRFRCDGCHQSVSKWSLVFLVGQITEDNELLWYGDCHQCTHPRMAVFECGRSLLWARA
jgi:hypothetical protein